MKEEWWERPSCFICDWWWAILLGMALILAAYFTRNYWLPGQGIPAAEPTRVAQLGTGDIQVTLTWESTNDLDLWVTDPAGETIFFRHAASQSGGQLDVDANADCIILTPHPVENIFWPSGAAPEGEYVVAVQYYKQCESDAVTAYKISLLVNGTVKNYEGVISAVGEMQEVTRLSR